MTFALLLGLILLGAALSSALWMLWKSTQSQRLLEQQVHELRRERQAIDQHAIVSKSDLKGRITYVNERFSEVSGYGRSELIGQDHAIVNSGTHPPEFFVGMWRTIASGQIWHGDVRNRRKDGKTYWVSSTIVPVLDATGKPSEYLSIRTDITAQKELEAQIGQQQQFFRGMTDALGEGVFAQDMEGRCTYINREAERMLGWRRRELLGSKLADLIAPPMGEPGQEMSSSSALDQAVRTGLSFRNDDVTFHSKSGQRIPVAITVNALMLDQQRIGTVIAFQDVTERKRQERELRQAQASAEMANRAKSLFLANMSHEIRTPMNAIIGMTHLVQQTTLTPQQQSYLEQVQTAGQSLLKVITDVLDYSKVEAGDVALEHAPFDFRRVVDDAVSQVIARARNKGLIVQVEVPPELPPRLIGDASRLVQVLGNLLSNAVKFTNQGSIAVRTRTTVRPNGRLQLKVGVSDTGVGMEAGELTQLFLPFSQSDGSSTRKFGGTGLGLFISKKLVELMGGDIAVESVKGRGTTVTFTVAVDVAREQAWQESTPMNLAAGELGDIRVLLAEDNDISRKLVTELIERRGGEVTAVVDGREAWRELNEAPSPLPWDLVLMDIEMPELGGIELTRKLRADPRFRDLPILAMTAHGSVEERERCLAAGMNDHLVKPIPPQQLYGALARWAGRWQGLTSHAGWSSTELGGPPSASHLNIQGVEVDAGLNNSAGDVDLYLQMLRLFLTHHEFDGEHLENLVASQQWDDAERLAHSMKSVAAGIGLSGLGATSRELEGLLRVKSPLAILQPYVTRFVTQLHEGIDAVRAGLARIETESPPLLLDDGADYASVLAQLSAMLKAHSGEALDCFDAHTALLQQNMENSDYNAFQRAITAFDFDAALELLNTLPGALPHAG